MSHKLKKTLANKLRTREEEKKRVPIFQTKAWEQRAAARQTKANNRIKKAQARKAKRAKKV